MLKHLVSINYREWYWNYNTFNCSAPLLGLKYHQLCLGPFTWEWQTGVLNPVQPLSPKIPNIFGISKH